MTNKRYLRIFLAGVVIVMSAMTTPRSVDAQDDPGSAKRRENVPMQEEKSRSGDPLPENKEPATPTAPDSPAAVSTPNESNPASGASNPESASPTVSPPVKPPPVKPTPVKPTPVTPTPVTPTPVKPVPEPVSPAPVPASMPSAAEQKAAEKQRLLARIEELQGKRRRPKGPFGTRLYATPNLDLSLGYAAPAALDGATSITRYVDRGGYLPQILLIILQAAGAQAEANQAGRTIEKEVYVGSSVGMNVELYGLEKDELEGAVYDLYWIIADQDKKYPSVVNFGFTAGNMGVGFGLLAEGIIPFGSRLNLEVGGRIGLGDSWYQLHIAGVGNITDRFYGRAAYQYVEDLGSGYVGSLGVRL